jgi:mono/diheme cytochrome c family protein
MDPTRDNPFIRFTTFWWGIASFLVFAVLIGAIWIFNRSEPSDLEDVAAKPRYETKAAVDAEQNESYPAAQMGAAIANVSKQLAASKPVAVEDPAQLVPGSATAKKLAEAPAVDTSAIDTAAADEGPVDPAVMETGKTQYMVCGACHGQNGEGTPAGPPLAGSEWVTGPVSNLILIQLRGLQGPITVAGKEYHFPGGMAPMGYQNDEQIAAVLTYIRNSFGNKASSVKPEQVAALRGEVGKPQVKVEELTKP